MEKKQRWIAMFLAVLSLSTLMLGGDFYLKSMRRSLWHQSVLDILEVTSQGAHAFEVYTKKDMEMVDNLANNISEYDSFDEVSILNKLDMLKGSEDNYSVIDLEKGILYSDGVSSGYKLDSDGLGEYNNLYGEGICEPYLDEYTGLNMIGYYKKIVFRDGIQGVVRKGQLVSSLADEFSLSFYDDAGFSYIIDGQGDILINSRHKNSSNTYKNVFDVVRMEGNDEEDIETFRKSVDGGKKGVMRFDINNEENIFAFVPIENTYGLYLVSIIPDSVILEQANHTLKTSQTFIFVIGISIIIFLVFLSIIRQYRKTVREKESEVKYREQLFGILAKNTNDVFLMLKSDDFTVEYVSPNVERVLGIKRETAKNDVLSLGKASYSDGSPIGYNTLKEIQLGESVVFETERINRKSGEKGWYTEVVYRIRLEKMERFIVVISDRTAYKKSEDALKEALDIAKAANESKSTFLSNMSHDIRTPMNAIVGLAALLQRDAGNPQKVQEHTKKIVASSRHLLGLINDILDMSKIESGKTTLNIGEVNVFEIVNELGTIIRPQAKAKNQEFEITVKDIHSEHLFGDKLRINQILINILSNSVKYTPEGGRINMVVCQLAQNAKNYAHMRFIVKDNGIGMAEDYQKWVFHPFSREVNSTVNHIQGTGLGMAITKNLVDLMGGTISVESHLGKGSTFMVDLELRICRQDVDNDFWKKYGVTNTLIVDDEEDVCTNIIGAMDGTGVSVQYALDGHSAVKMAERAYKDGHSFDLVLLDWKMPGMNGIETAKQIRKTVPVNVPIMIITAFDFDDIEEEAMTAGINGFMQKPFFLGNFQQTIINMKSKDVHEEDDKAKYQVIKGKKFLAAEDIELNAEILMEILDMMGASYDVAKDGKEALEKFESSKTNQYDAILMDVQMPVMNGYDATRAIRACSHPQAKTIPIIAMTANAFVDDINDAIKAGMDAHIAKPIDIGRLEEVMKEMEEKGKV